MDEALVENAEHNVDDDDRSQQQRALAPERLLKDLGCARKASRDGWRQPEPPFHILDFVDGFAQGHSRRQIEEDRDGGELSLMIDGQGAGQLAYIRYRPKWNQLARRRAYEHLRQGLLVLLKRRAKFQNHGIIVARREDGRDLPGAERIIERRPNLLCREAERRGLLAVDVEHGLRAFDLQVGGDVLKAGQLPDFRLNERCKSIELFEISGLQGVLIETPAGAHADFEILGGIQEDIDPGDRGDLAPQFLNNLGDGRPLIARFELDVQMPAVHPESSPSRADFAVVGSDIRISLYDGV